VNFADSADNEPRAPAGAPTHPAVVVSVDARAVDVPLNPPLQTASGTMPSAPLVLIDILTSADVVGRSYVFCYSRAAVVPVRQLVAELGPVLAGSPLSPLRTWDALRTRFRLLGTTGLIGLAVNGVDMALWDALARLSGLSLAALLGADEIRPIAAYGSLRSMRAEDAASEASDVLSTRVRALKVKIGAAGLEEDLRVISQLRALAGDDIGLMVDYNQSLDLHEALQRCRRLDQEGLAWIEEPVAAEDVDACARIASETVTPIQAGESWWSPAEARRSLAAGGSDHTMLDVARIGGVTGWLRAAPLATAAGSPISSHIYPEVSAHLLSATAGAHLLEWLDLAGPVLARPMAVRDGVVYPQGPGSGIDWDEDAVARFLVT
jgi:mandelate racemase